MLGITEKYLIGLERQGLGRGSHDGTRRARLDGSGPGGGQGGCSLKDSYGISFEPSQEPYGTNFLKSIKY